jgi:hypothetical protein
MRKALSTNPFLFIEEADMQTWLWGELDKRGKFSKCLQKDLGGSHISCLHAGYPGYPDRVEGKRRSPDFYDLVLLDPKDINTKETEELTHYKTVVGIELKCRYNIAFKNTLERLEEDIGAFKKSGENTARYGYVIFVAVSPPKSMAGKIRDLRMGIRKLKKGLSHVKVYYIVVSKNRKPHSFWIK